MPTNLKHNKERGFSMVEMIVYIVILVFMLAIVFMIVVSITKTERSLSASRSLENSSVFGLDRMVREIRQAKSVDAVSSVLDTSPGKLVLNSLTSAGANEAVEFYTREQVLYLKINGVEQGALTEPSTRVTALTFSLMNTPHSQAVRVQTTMESGTSTTYHQERFYTTALLRDSL